MAESTNGSTQPSSKGNGATRRVARRKQGYIAWSISLIARLATWAAIFTVLFRCPPTFEECDETSPFVCKHYFQVKNAVSPHAKPYYEKYAAPYVEVAQPYYDTFKTNVVTPARDYAVLYGEPWANKGRDFALEQWRVNGQPRIAQLQAAAAAQYDKSLAPHVSKATALAEPYYAVARAQGGKAVDSYVYPTYQFTKPYAIKGYNASHNFAVMTLLPAAQWGWDHTNAFLDRAVWPQLRVVYVENVEPQLVRIGERLGRYKSHAKSKVLREATTSRTSSSSPSTTGSSTESYVVSKPAPQSTTQDANDDDGSQDDDIYAATEADVAADIESESEHVRSPVEAPEPEEDETEKQRKVRQMVADDLESWQEKFASQAEQGAAEIEDSVDEIARRMIDEKANTVGASLITQLEDVIKTEIDGLKDKINSLVSRHLGGEDVDTQEETVQAVRAAGVAIKSKAQIIRGWREQYDEELQSTVLATSDVHFAILDETRSLALQQIGMKWAWTDGVTYKDWAKYHDLKSTLSDWTDELKQLIVTHPTLLEAQDAVVQIEDNGMTIASAAAKELASLKEVIQWKIEAEDTTDEFDSKKLQAIIEERARAAEEARLKAEEEARVKAEEEARIQAEEEARAKAEEEARVAEEAAEEAAKAAAEQQSESEDVDDTAEDDEEDQKAHTNEKRVPSDEKESNEEQEESDSTSTAEASQETDEQESPSPDDVDDLEDEEPIVHRQREATLPVQPLADR